MTELLSEAFMIMVTGMVTVFTFLTILIGAMGLLRVVADKPEPSTASVDTPSASQLAAITAAIHQYRNRH